MASHFDSSILRNQDKMDMIQQIVELNTKWIEEQSYNTKPPQAIYAGAENLPLQFSSKEEYLALLNSMLRVEIWNAICEEYTQNRKKLEEKKFYFIVKNFKIQKNMVLCNCVAALPYPLLQGTLCIFHVVSQNDGITHPIFGYVISSSYDNNALPHIFTYTNRLVNAKLFQFEVFVKYRGNKNHPMLDKLMEAFEICNLRSKVDLVIDLSLLEVSPVAEYIMKPKITDFCINLPTVTPDQELHQEQEQAIQSISQNLKNLHTKIIILQGPPGTGKTYLIIELLKNVFQDNKNKKILVCAPSNTAVDQIETTLINLNSTLKQPLNFVRISTSKPTNKDLIKNSLNEKARKRFEDEKYNMKVTSSQKTNLSMKQCQQQVLKNSNIVLSTLRGCGQNIMKSVFKNDSQNTFSCCIIDEATQCTEVETLQVLRFGITKLVLVGDTQQLPPAIKSNFAIQNGFSRSMFERFQQIISKDPTKNPIFVLKEQFRMHSEICNFPSKHFYRNQLFTSPQTDTKYVFIPIAPYRVYNITHCQYSEENYSKTIEKEEHIISEVLEEIQRLHLECTIGIIIPQISQYSSYQNLLQKNPCRDQIEINTVENFQGREKDIVIVSCVRADCSAGKLTFLLCKKRMNVALTRAKYSLVVIGNFSKLDTNWQALLKNAQKRKVLYTV